METIGNDVVEKLQKLFACEYNTIILRRCQAYGKAIEFHTDEFSTNTLQVSVNSDEEYLGGKLIYATEEKLHIPKRSIGTITIHNDKIVHGVNEFYSGIRYGLFLLKK